MSGDWKMMLSSGWATKAILRRGSTPLGVLIVDSAWRCGALSSGLMRRRSFVLRDWRSGRERPSAKTSFGVGVTWTSEQETELVGQVAGGLLGMMCSHATVMFASTGCTRLRAVVWTTAGRMTGTGWHISDWFVHVSVVVPSAIGSHFSCALLSECVASSSTLPLTRNVREKEHPTLQYGEAW